MQPEPGAATAPRSAARTRDVAVVLGALAIAVVLERIVGNVARTGGLPNPIAQVLVADLAIWVPLAVGAAWVLRRSDRKALPARLGLGLADVIAAVGIAIVVRAVDAGLSIAFFGVTGLTPQATLGAPDVALLVVAAVGTCLVSPFLEEVVFRGLLQRRIAAELGPRTRFVAVLIAAFTFALMHVLVAGSTSSLAGLEVFLTTFLLGLLTGTLVAMTNRIGGAVLAHVLFNTAAVVLTWPR